MVKLLFGVFGVFRARVPLGRKSNGTELTDALQGLRGVLSRCPVKLPYCLGSEGANSKSSLTVELYNYPLFLSVSIPRF